jgi:hypothetical protein
MFVFLSRIAHRTQHSHWNPQPNSFRKVFVTPQSHQLTACGDTEYLCDFCLCTVRSYTLLALARSCAQGLLDRSIFQEGEPPLKKAHVCLQTYTPLSPPEHCTPTTRTRRLQTTFTGKYKIIHERVQFWTKPEAVDRAKGRLCRSA